MSSKSRFIGKILLVIVAIHACNKIMDSSSNAYNFVNEEIVSAIPDIPPTTRNDLPTISVDDFKASIIKYIDTPYRFGGTSPSGIDCSGLPFMIYKENGITLPRHSSKQFLSGERVNANDSLCLGDLLFFVDNSRSRRINHVAVYLKDGQFIHASKMVGEIIISSLDDGNFRNRFIGARRVAKFE